MARALCILVLLCFAPCCAENSKTEHRFNDLQVQEDLLSWLKPQEKWEPSKRQTLEDLLYKLTNYKSENRILPQQPGDTENQEKNRRDLDNLRVQQRQFGCRMFFWKSWTYC
ncbi:somatostatin-1A-like [Takifugu rubripes]|uniref:Somatostatin-1A-like n=2 Tax=Takifugu TaxID=31032 RepID=A0A674MRE6_TAKRU|nr:somatostatin-1A-like [Takifugu rubripes]XP_056912017.1 somatostatin-1A-like [Takifugu flavidus]TWW73280.1 hypothetical protein D4764_15G0006740 [Takifugu flavidus]|eukprot:XP_011614748.1 PREDICTED: somatostatin-1A-like [Takifugu rubripes]